MKIKFKVFVDVEAELAAVAQDGYALQYVKEQTEAVCFSRCKI